MADTTTDHTPEEWQRAQRRVGERRDVLSHLVAFLVVNTALIVIWAVTGAGFFWPAWVIALWGAGLILHAWSVYINRPVNDADVEAQLERDRRRTSTHP